jgi:C4-dicarboxylate transporter DctQ subunit
MAKTHWLGRLARYHDNVTKVTNVLAQLAISVVVFCFLYEMASRFVFNSPTWWASEFVSYALCISVFCMMPELARTQSNVAITVLVERLSTRVQIPVYWAIFMVCTVVCGSVAGMSLMENVRQFTENVSLMRNEPIPKWWVSVFITYGFASTTMYFLRALTPERVREAIATQAVTIS